MGVTRGGPGDSAPSCVIIRSRAKFDLMKFFDEISPFPVSVSFFQTFFSQLKTQCLYKSIFWINLKNKNAIMGLLLFSWGDCMKNCIMCKKFPRLCREIKMNYSKCEKKSSLFEKFLELFQDYNIFETNLQFLKWSNLTTPPPPHTAYTRFEKIKKR